MHPTSALRAVLRSLLVAMSLLFVSCISSGWTLSSYSPSDIKPPANKFAISYATGYGNFSYDAASQARIGIGGSSELATQARRLFAETGFFASVQEGISPTGLSLLIRSTERSSECTWGCVVTGFTLTIVPAPVMYYEHHMEAELRRDGVLLQTFAYDETATMWFGIVCFPAFLIGQPFRAGNAMAEKLLLNLLHDLGQPAVLQRIEGAASQK
jgi:hypothetical protein